MTGEKIDPKYPHTKTALADIWSTLDGENWKQEAKTTVMGTKFLSALVKVKERGTDAVYIFGGAYDSKNQFDTSVYKTNDMINFNLVGKLPSTGKGDMRRNIVVYYQNKFWLLNGSGIEGIWTSYDGANWTQEMKEAPWKDNPNYVYLQSALALKDQILFVSSLPSVPWIAFNYTSSDGKNWTGYNSLTPGYFPSWRGMYSPLVFKDKILTFARHDSEDTGIPITYGYFYNIWHIALADSLNPSKPQERWTSTSYPPTIPFAIEKHHSEELAEVFVPFNNKLYSIGGALHGKSSGEKWIPGGNDKTNTSGKVWVSDDGLKWAEAPQKGVTYPGPADRSMAVATTLPWFYSSPSAPDLEITSYKGTSYISKSVQDNVTLGEWKLSANSKDGRTTFTGKIKIKALELDGTAIPPDSSTLEAMQNIRVYIDGDLSNSVLHFDPPYYYNPCAPSFDCGFTVQKKIYIFPGGKYDLLLSQGQSVMIKVVADLNGAPLVSTNYLYGLIYNTKQPIWKPCTVYMTDPADSTIKIPGKTIKINKHILPVIPKNIKKGIPN